MTRITAARRIRVQGQVRNNSFQENDLFEIRDAIDRVLELLPRRDLGESLGGLTPLPFDPNKLPDLIQSLATTRGGNFPTNVDPLRARIQGMLSDDRLAEIIAPDDFDDSFSDWLKGMLGESGDNESGQITVLDLSLIPIEVLTTVISVIARIVFEAAQRHRRSAGSDSIPIVIVLEEAHNFVHEQASSDDSMPQRRCRFVFEKIAKEGRKFGVGLVLSSQRPAELSPTVVAQCNSFLLHRIVNDRDQDLIRRLVPEGTGAVLKELPSLPAQQAILLGLATEIPLAVQLRTLEKEQCPRSLNPEFWNVWTGQKRVRFDIDQIADSWQI